MSTGDRCTWTRAVAVMVYLSAASLVAQDSTLAEGDLRVILASVDAGTGWDWHAVGEFVAARYRHGARDAVSRVLAEPPTDQDVFLHVHALAVARYPAVGVDKGLLLTYARGGAGEDVSPAIRGTLRQFGLMALTARPDPELAAFWDTVARYPEAAYRQFAAPGLACALGLGAVPRIRALTLDSDSVVSAVASRYLDLVQSDPPRVCLWGTATRDSVVLMPLRLRPELQVEAERRLGRRRSPR